MFSNSFKNIYNRYIFTFIFNYSLSSFNCSLPYGPLCSL